MRKYFFFTFKPEVAFNLTTIVLRISAALMLLHGWPKLMKFSEKAEAFSDPLGIGHTGSLALTVFAEFFCTILIVLGCCTRVATIPLMFLMGIIIFVVHTTDPFPDKELAWHYLLLYLAIFFLGPGKYSVDRQILKAA
ncbi:MAG TPA: DoxX family protein [Bacteroidia bacterium]|nr:DoxX family protein [Bacteroidia bacterium]